MEDHHTREHSTHSWAYRYGRLLGTVAAAALFGGALGWAHLTDEKKTEVAGSQATTTLTTDGHATLHFGILPDVRMHTNSTFGVDVTLGNSLTPASSTSDAEMLNSLGQSFGAFLYRPEAEIEAIASQTRERAAEALGIALLGALGAAGGIRYAGDSLNMIANRIASDGHMAPILAVATAASFSAFAHIESNMAEFEEVGFVKITDKVPEAATVPFLANMEIRDIPLTSSAARLMQGAIQSYEQSQTYFDGLKAEFEQQRSLLHTPQEGQRVGIVVSDRHDNILADQLLRDVADAAGASFVMNLGDNTASGSSYEAFSLRSFNEAFKGMTIMVLIGNHDQGSYVKQYWKHEGAIVASDKVVEYEGIRFILRDDYRTSDFTPERAINNTTKDEMINGITRLACDSDERVDVALLPQASIGREALEKGCVTLVLGGDTHQQTTLEEVVSEDRVPGYTQTVGTSGGAAYAVTIGKFRREASVMLVTFNDEGSPIGTQSVLFTTTGNVKIEHFQEMSPS